MSDIDTTNNTEQDQDRPDDDVTVMVHPDAPGNETRVGSAQVKLMESVGWRAKEQPDKAEDAPPVRGDQPDGNPVADEAPAAPEATTSAGEQATAGDAGTTENDPAPKRRR